MPEDDTVYYDIATTSGNGVSAFQTSITIGTEEDNVTQTISIIANGYGIYSDGDGATSAVIL